MSTAAPGAPSTLRARTLRAVGWTTTARIFQQAVQFGLTLYLMRVLGPDAFGLIGMVLVFTGFAGIFADLGFGPALVQRPEVREEHRSAAFWLTLALGAALTATLFAAAPLVGAFYRSHDLIALTRWLSVGFILAAPAVIPRALLEREMRFNRLAQVDMFALLCSGAAAIAAAASGAGVWSLVFQSLVGIAVRSLLLVIIVPWRPRANLHLAAARDLAGFGAGLTGFTVINYWARKTDDLLIGRFMGPTLLGFYSRAYSLMLLPISQVISVLAPVMFPALSTIQDDHERVRRAYLRALGLISFFSFPMMLGLLAIAPTFVQLFLGPAWAPAIPIIQILSVVGVLQAMCNPVGWLYTSQGKTGQMFLWGAVSSAVLIGSLVAGVFLGSLESVAWCYLAAVFVLTWPTIALAGRLIGLRFSSVVTQVWSNFVAAVGMSAAVFGLEKVLSRHLSSPALFTLELLAGASLYAGFALAFRLPSALDFLSIVKIRHPLVNGGAAAHADRL